jgi:ribokinase
MVLGRSHGVRTILNPAPAAELDDAILRNVDYLTPNETELRKLLGLSDDDDSTPTPILAERLVARGARNLIVTMGDRGALVVSEAGTYRLDGIRLNRPVVDSTGAGDAFNGALAVALASGRSLSDAVTFACCAGRLACDALGVIPGLAPADQVEALLDESQGARRPLQD